MRHYVMCQIRISSWYVKMAVFVIKIINQLSVIESETVALKIIIFTTSQ